MTKRGDSFSLGDRGKVLDQIETSPLLVHVALAENQKVGYEEIFRSCLKHLIDAATNEFLFVVDFFRTQPKDTFNRIYGKTITALLEHIENYLLACYDIVGILILIRMTHLMRLVMQRRRIPVLDPMFDRISLLLWPRFKQLFDANVKSLKQAQIRGKSSATTMMLGASVDLSPHYVSRRYAELVASILLLHIQTANNLLLSSSAAAVAEDELQHASLENVDINGGGELMVQQDLHLLRGELIQFLERSAAALSSFKEQRVFLVNNYDLVGSFIDSWIV